MGQVQRSLDDHQARLIGLWERMVRTLGVYTVNVVLDRAIWQAAQQYPELACIKYSDSGLAFEALAEAPPDERAYEALYDEMLMIMARLLGKDLARRLIDEFTPGETIEPSR